MPPTMEKDLEGKTFLVTGANTGIGRVTALELARRGGHVVITCRSEDKARPVIDEIKTETKNEAIEALALELADLASVREAARRFLERDTPLHCLINNAGLAGTRGLTKDGFELTFGVNHLGHFLFTSLLLDRIKASAPARIVNVSSKAHYKADGIDFEALRRPTATISGVPEYGVSKLCNVLFTKELARRLEASGVTTYALHPGVVASDVWRRIPWPIRPLMKMGMITLEQGALTTLHCATSPEVATQSGRYYDKCKEREPSVLAKDEELAKRLWEKSEAWTSAK
jgi:NAD(P)-dependent dehydrogenase (short-subunit alcohol dehydrogenase family)